LFQQRGRREKNVGTLQLGEPVYAISSEKEIPHAMRRGNVARTFSNGKRYSQQGEGKETNCFLAKENNPLGGVKRGLSRAVGKGCAENGQYALDGKKLEGGLHFFATLRPVCYWEKEKNQV